MNRNVWRLVCVALLVFFLCAAVAGLSGCAGYLAQAHQIAMDADDSALGGAKFVICNAPYPGVLRNFTGEEYQGWLLLCHFTQVKACAAQIESFKKACEEVGP